MISKRTIDGAIQTLRNFISSLNLQIYPQCKSDNIFSLRMRKCVSSAILYWLVKNDVWPKSLIWFKSSGWKILKVSEKGSSPVHTQSRKAKGCYCVPLPTLLCWCYWGTLGGLCRLCGLLLFFVMSFVTEIEYWQFYPENESFQRASSLQGPGPPRRYDWAYMRLVVIGDSPMKVYWLHSEEMMVSIISW